MASITKSIDVNVLVRTAYNQWTQFEEFSHFMDGVERVTQIDDTHVRWEVNINGKKDQWDAEITEQIPDERVAWKSLSGQPNGGVVRFHRLGPDDTRVTVQIEWEPQDVAEQMGSMLGFDAAHVEKDLERFKQFIEERGAPTGAWRGSVSQSSTS